VKEEQEDKGGGEGEAEEEEERKTPQAKRNRVLPEDQLVLHDTQGLDFCAKPGERERERE
jgi:hypothetical protein